MCGTAFGEQTINSNIHEYNTTTTIYTTVDAIKERKKKVNASSSKINMESR